MSLLLLCQQSVVVCDSVVSYSSIQLSSVFKENTLPFSYLMFSEICIVDIRETKEPFLSEASVEAWSIRIIDMFNC